MDNENRTVRCPQCGQVFTSSRDLLLHVRKHQNKYGAIKTEYNGHIYASKREAMKARELDLLKAAGEVLEWKPQPQYLIIPRFIKNGHIHRKSVYTGDFWVKYKDGSEEVIEVKGSPRTVTPDSMLRMKMFDYKYPELKLRIEYDVHNS